jgi:hypothetical protein
MQHRVGLLMLPEPERGTTPGIDLVHSNGPGVEEPVGGDFDAHALCPLPPHSHIHAGASWSFW